MPRRPLQSLKYPLTAHQVEVLNSMLEVLFREFRRGETTAETLVGVLDVEQGGTGKASFTPYTLVAGGITSTEQLQSLSDTGTLGQILTSQGPGTLPIWDDAPETGQTGEWSVLTDGDVDDPELIFAGGDVIMVFTPD